MPHKTERVVPGLLALAFIGGLGALGCARAGWSWVRAEGRRLVHPGRRRRCVFTSHPLLVAVPSAACFVLGLLDRGRPWRVEHLDLLALAGLIPVALLLSDALSAVGLWLVADCPVPWVPKTYATGLYS
jgi:hypothetical protein